MRTEDIIDKIFNRQYERMRTALKEIGMPDGYMAIISKYWNFGREDLKDKLGKEENNESIVKNTRECV